MERMTRTRGAAWTTPSRAALAVPSTRAITLSWLVRISVSACFLIAFTQYELSSAITNYLALMALGFSGLLVLCGSQRADRVQNILGGGGLLFAAMLFGEVISYTSGDTYSELYGLVFIGIFLCARLVVQEIGVPNVIRAYSQAAILTVCLILISGRQAMFAAQSSRFSGGTRAHPNLVGFVMAGYFPVIIWRAIEEKAAWKKKALIVLSVATFAILFLTGSRGSLSAVLFAGGALLVRAVGSGWLKRVRLRHLHMMAFLILIPLVAMFLFENNRVGRIGDYLNDFLSLSTSQRGLKSGLSGRTSIWHIAFRLLAARDRWLFGFGYRAGDRMVGTIDNGYVQLLFESGLIAGGMIFGSMVRVFFVLWKASSARVNNAWTRYYMMLWCLMIVYFLNNISTRYLFSFGSPFSLCVLFLMAASPRELAGQGRHARVARKQVTLPRRPASAFAWDRSGR
jgi:O-antigen ligase